MQFNVDWTDQAISDVLPGVDYLFELLEQSFTVLTTTVSNKGNAVLSGEIDGVEYRTVIQGSDLVYSSLSGPVKLSGGDVESIEMGRVEGGKFKALVVIEGGVVSGADIFIAAAADLAATNEAAIENLFGAIGFQYSGTDLTDTFARGTLSSDGARINLNGNDRVDLMGGDDSFFLGRGKDKAFGDQGNDSIFGAAGNDRLFGGTDNDLLSGGSGKDRLNGDSGNDRLLGGDANDILNGGAGKDRMIGGTGSDIMNGGLGADTFFFASNTGVDQINDYTAGEDRLKINWSGVIDTEATADGLLVSWGEDSVFLLGITSESDVTFL
jgi:Ca2+-binding RTX toxin-like protein